MSLQDTRLLTSLLKAENDAANSFGTWVKDASSAASSLTAWSVANSSDTQDLMDAALRISSSLATLSEPHKQYLHSMAEFRTALNELLTKINSLKTVLKDREILASRLSKLGSKRPSDSNFEKHQKRVEEAERELTACETFLQNEALGLTNAKRKVFKEDLAFKMKCMANLGHHTSEVANEALLVLSQLGSDLKEYTIKDYSSRAFSDLGSDESLDPPPQLSRIESRSSSVVSFHTPPIINFSRPLSSASIDPPTPKAVSNPFPIVNANRLLVNPSIGTDIATPKAISIPPASHARTDSTPSVMSSPAAPISFRSSRMSVPSAPPPVTSSYDNAGMPSFDIPKAPSNVGTVRPDQQDSSDEDFEDLSRPSRPLEPPSPNHRLMRRRAVSDSGSLDGRRKRSSFFEGLASFFRRKDKKADDEDDDFEERHKAADWTTRTNKNLRTVKKTPSISGSVNETSKSKLRSKSRSAEGSETSGGFIKHYNDPEKRIRASSESGAFRKTTAPSTLKKKKKSASSLLSATEEEAPHFENVATSQPASRPLSRRFSQRTASEYSPPAIDMRTPTAPPRFASVTSAASSPLVPEGAALTPASSVRRKTKKPKDPERTVVLSAEDLGIPRESYSISMARSNTTMSRESATSNNTATAKKKKKKKLETVPEAVIPTAEDLAGTLPSSRSRGGLMFDDLPLPTPTNSPGQKSKRSSQSTIKANGSPDPTKVLMEHAKTDKHEAALLGTDTWIPAQKTRKGRANGAHPETLMEVVDKSEAPSRSYSWLAVPDTHSRNTSVDSAKIDRRKSVRLNDVPADLANSPLHTPASSIKSASMSPSPSRGILVNNYQSVAQIFSAPAEPVSTWTSRSTADDSSDDDDYEYSQARKSLGKATMNINNAMSGRFSAAEKGKGRAID